MRDVFCHSRSGSSQDKYNRVGYVVCSGSHLEYSNRRHGGKVGKLFRVNGPIYSDKDL